MDAADLELLAGIAHRCWCAKMLRSGWRHGAYSPEERTHDALVAFEELSRRDQREARLAVELLHLDRSLFSEIRYDRGPAREFLLEDMQVGLKVAMNDGDSSKPADRGQIESWQSEPDSGELLKITVRWETGEVSEHYPGERELRRL